MTMSKKQVSFATVTYESDECTSTCSQDPANPLVAPSDPATTANDGKGDEDEEGDEPMLWYTQKDMKRIQTREKLLMEMYTKCKKNNRRGGKGSSDDGAMNILKAYSTLGLLTIKQYRARKAHQREVMMHVIDEQERQIQNELNDIEFMSTFYSQITATSVKEAHQIAMQLEEYVMNGMVDDEDITKRKPSTNSTIFSSIKRTMSGSSIGRKKKTSAVTTTVTSAPGPSATAANGSSMSNNLKRQRRRFLFGGNSSIKPTKV